MPGRTRILALFAVLAVALAPAQGSERPFRLGFTPYPPDVTDEAIAWTYAGISTTADLIAHHFDNGVPWEEALRGLPYPRLVADEIARRLASTPDGMPVYLAVTPISSLRDGLALAWTDEGAVPLEEPWAGRSFDHPAVRKAFFRHCVRMIDTFHPDYFAYAVEIDLLARLAPERFPALRKLLRTTYRKLEARYPELPIFFTFTLGQPGRWDDVRSVVEPLLPLTDVLAVSTYPYLAAGLDGRPQNIPEDWFSQARNLDPEKPFAVAETGFTAEPVDLPTLGVHLPGRKAWQKRYVKDLLAEMTRLRASFVVWFVLGDYDLLWERAEAMGAPELFKAWRDTGLYDEKLHRRPALKVWKRFLRRNLHTGP
ncbi:MAG: hypothetical protein R2991_04130 [Thermoanaerobaculia bacterium]